MVFWKEFGAIKCKADCKKFRQNVQTDANRGVRIRNEHGNVIEFIRNGDDWSVSEYVSDLGFGWVTCEIASDTNPGYKDSVDGLIWKYRKAINEYLHRD